jgi:RES domain-containing protein
MRVWRITRSPFAATAFSGDGARLYAARWNPVGVGMVYTSLSLPMAALETFVHLEPRVEPGDLVSIAAEVPIELDELDAMQKQMLARLPGDWREATGMHTRKIGEEWVRAEASLFLLVPSVVIADEWNLLINPAHPDANRIVVGKAKPFQFDERMFNVPS